ncbi:MAG TPA: thioesterase family protein [Ktedonobacterales bacterium]|jgi:acyl-CoA thioesterase FadM
MATTDDDNTDKTTTMMQPTTLEGLLAEGGVRRFAGGLEVEVRRAWIVAGEDRLAYTAIVRLVECCREWHWQSDILPHAGGAPLDSITKSFTAEFSHPIALGSLLRITHQVIDARPRSYRLRFELTTLQPGQRCAMLEMVSVFYDPAREAVAEPPAAVAAYLRDCVSPTQPQPADDTP